GTTLRVVSSTQGTVAEYEFPSQTWWMGAAAAVEDQQVLMLHGMIPPGEAVIQRSVGSFHGVGFFLVYSTGASTGVDLQYGRIRPHDGLRPRTDATSPLRSVLLPN